MAGIELLVPTEDKTPHLFYLVPFIHAFRHKHGPQKRAYEYDSYPGEKEGKGLNADKFTFYRKEFDEETFFDYVETNLDDILNEVNLRWALSIITCYADGHSNVNIRLQANQICNLIRFDSYHLSFVDRMQIDRLEYKKLSNEFWANHLLQYKGRDHKKVPIKYLDGFWNNIGATDSISLLYMRNYKLITNITLSKLFRFSISKLLLHWASLFKVGAKGTSIEDIDKFLDKHYKEAEYNERTYNNINWDEYD